MLRAYHAEAQRRGAQTSFLEVAESNPIAIGLYRAGGYVESGRRKAYYTSPEGGKIDALVFAKSFQTV